MNLQTILIISLTSYFTFLKAESQCYQSGKTWSSFGQIALIPEVSSVQACIQFCTGKSLSEALIFATSNPQYEDRLFIELQVQ